MTPRGAVVRSVVLPGWGLVSAGDRRGLAVLAAAGLGLVALVALALPYADSSAVTWVFLAGAALTLAWAGQALLAWRRAVRRRATFGLPTHDGGAMAVLWLAPAAIAAATVFWSLAGAGASPAARAAAYAGAWWADHPERVADAFAPPVQPDELEAAWARQEPRLHNALVAAAVQAGPGSGIDPERPFESIRFTEEPVGADPTTRTIRMEIVTRVLTHGTVLGLFQTTSQRLDPVDSIGTIELRLERLPGPVSGLPQVESWRIARVVALDEVVGG